MRRAQYILMLSTSARTRGGISSVVNSYAESGLFDRWPVVRIVTHEEGSSAHKLVTAVRGLALFSALLIAGRVCLVHVHAASNASFWRKAFFILLARAVRKPVIFHLHGGGFAAFYRTQRSSVLRRMVRWILDGAAEVVVLSEEWKGKLSTITRNPHVTVIRNPVPPDMLRVIEGIERRQQTVLFVGRLEREKGIFDLLEAMSRIRKRLPEARLVLAGDGDLDGVRRRARELGIDGSVQVLGWVDGARKRGAFAEASVFVLPSYTEGLPVALLEAMAAELPIVATDVGGIPSVVEQGVNGFLVKPGKIEALTEALISVLDDAILRNRMGEQARKRILKDFTPQKVIEQVELLYRRHGMKPRNTEARVSPNLGRG